ncbi:MAG: molybdenum cofactor guanylyltransferase MobA [Amaricoccus sp.]
MPDPIPPLAGILLAGGRAERFGGIDKGLVALAGRPLLAHAIARLRPQVAALALNANGDPTRFAAFGLPVIPDPVPDQPGPLAGILAGLDWAAARGLPAAVTVACDTPFFPRDLVARLAPAAGPGCAIAASRDTDGGLQPHPTFGLWPVSLRAPLRAALAAGERRVRAFAESQGGATVPFADPDGFFNINRPADLDAARARWQSGDMPD